MFIAECSVNRVVSQIHTFFKYSKNVLLDEIIAIGNALKLENLKRQEFEALGVSLIHNDSPKGNSLDLLFVQRLFQKAHFNRVIRNLKKAPYTFMIISGDLMISKALTTLQGLHYDIILVHANQIQQGKMKLISSLL
jgi:hypothetical protein